MLRKPSGSSVAVAIASASLFVAVGGASSAASAVSSLINGNTIKPGTVGHRQLAKHAVRGTNIALKAVGPANVNNRLAAEIARHGGLGPAGPAGPAGAKGATGAAGSAGAAGATGASGTQGARGATGPQGTTGQNGVDGINGANPGALVADVPSIASSSGHNPNPDSGDTGDQGFYFSGDGAGGSADLGNGELQLSGSGIDGATAQGGIGIAKAFNNVPLGHLDALSYMWHVNQPNGEQAPAIHITVTGLTNNSHFGSGFANLTLSPALNGGVTVQQGVVYATDGFAANTGWYSTTQTAVGSGDINHPEPLSYFVSNDPNAVITQISLDNGGSSSGSGPFSAGADDLILGFTGSPFTRYDFGG